MTNQSSAAKDLTTKAQSALELIASADQLENWRIKYLGRKGLVSQLLRGVKDLPPAERQSAGQAANHLRQALEADYQKKFEEIQLTPSPRLGEGRGEVDKKGSLHPLTLTIRRLQEIFTDLGFMLVEGPLVEDPQYNFDLLNIPPEHPARAETDTFFVKGGHVLRTHTSPVQIRSVKENNLKPPFKVVSIGRCFRAEKLDPTHSHTFHQVENLVIGSDVTIATFKGVVEEFYSRFFKQAIVSRLRPSYFPFVEPGFEVDISCLFCQTGCRVCKRTGWIEMMGAGMVHPTVLKNMAIDPEQYQGYAFGGGIERLTMLQQDINDLRQFWSGDVKLISQFS